MRNEPVVGVGRHGISSPIPTDEGAVLSIAPPHRAGPEALDGLAWRTFAAASASRCVAILRVWFFLGKITL